VRRTVNGAAITIKSGIFVPDGRFCSSGGRSAPNGPVQCETLLLGVGEGVGDGGGGCGAPFPQLSWMAVCFTTPLQILGSAGFRALVFGATEHLFLPRQSFATIELVVESTPWQLASEV
jgi:hypothetical protein